MGKKKIYLTILLLGITLSGCEIQKDLSSQSDRKKESVSMWNLEPAQKIEKEDSSDKISLWEQDEYASMILEDEKALYFCGEGNIRRIEKENGRESYIFKSSHRSEEENKYIYSSATGNKGAILVNDTVYFVEKWGTQEKEETEGIKYALSMVKTDGSGYERIKEIEGSAAGQIVLLNGVLYFAENLNPYCMIGYKVDAEGRLLKQELVRTEPENLPQEHILFSYSQNGNRVLTPLESRKKWGYYLLRDENYLLCKVDPQSGKIENLPESIKNYVIEAVNDEFLFLISYENKQMCLYNIYTGNIEELGKFKGDIHVIFMDEEYLYYQQNIEEDSSSRQYFKRICLKNGRRENLFDTDEIVGMGIKDPWYLMDVSVLKGYIYYPGVKDYKLYLMRRKIDTPQNEEIIGKAFYDSRIGEIGYIKTFKEEICSKKNKDKKISDIDLEWLVVDDRFPGAAAVNTVLEEVQHNSIMYAHDYADRQDELYLDEDLAYAPTVFSFESNISPVYYWDGTYLSFVQQNAEYTGGAHSMPYWNGYTFNLQTGEMLALADIISDDEARVKELVTQYFEKYYREDPLMYWENADDMVFEYITLDSSFYLNEKGIVFYFAPYELASYAAGFQQIEVPYSEFSLKIELE